MAEIKLGSATFTDADVSALGSVRSLLGEFNGTTEEELGIDFSYQAYDLLCTIHDAVKVQFAGALEAEELEALGGTEAAERGWNALRKRNPNHDASTGARPIESFGDLPHKLKVAYAVFAQAVLNGGADAPEELADWEKELLAAADPKDPHEFKVGDKARVTGPAVWGDEDYPADPIKRGSLVEFRHSTRIDDDGDVYVYPVRSKDGEYIRHSSLSPFDGPRKWDRAEDVPDGVWFTPQDEDDNGKFLRGSKRGWYDFEDYQGRVNANEWFDSSETFRPNSLYVNNYAPFVEVIA